MIEDLLVNLKSYIQTGQVISYLAVFLGGILVSFTPCLYPLIPVTIGYIGANATSKSRGFLLSFIYVLGISCTYSILGLIASLGGKIFGEISTNPVSFLAVAGVCIILGLSAVGLFKLKLPSFLTNSKLRVKRQSPTLLFSFIVGLASGLVIGPCTVPVLGVILTFVATKHSLVFGSSLLFTFALGMGMLLIVVGTFAGVISTLPKAGPWMVKVQKLFGFILIGVGIYFAIKAFIFFL